VGILLAIAIPALTGYIQKADDVQYVSYARNCSVATRSVIEAAYAEGRFNLSPVAIATDYWSQGDPLVSYSAGQGNTKIFESATASEYLFPDDPANSDKRTLDRKAFELMANGDPPPNLRQFPNAPPWTICLVNSSLIDNTTILNSDAFIMLYFPDNGTDLPIIVTYKIDRITKDGHYGTFAPGYSWTANLVYNSDIGYEVYHFTEY
jgi:type II secretory pathway pseudopilin PulG